MGAADCCPAFDVCLQQVIDVDQKIETEAEENERVEKADNRPGFEKRFLKTNINQCFYEPGWEIIGPERRLSLRNNDIDSPKTLERQSATDYNQEKKGNLFCRAEHAYFESRFQEVRMI